MLNRLIYKLNKIIIYDYDDTNPNIIQCRSLMSGYFDSTVDISQYIKRHNNDTKCFFIARSYVFNPIHSGQTNDCVTERTYDCYGNNLCICPTHHFIVNYNEINGAKVTRFMGRNNCVCNNDDIGWYYDKNDETLRKCKIINTPYDTKTAKKYKTLEWYDDSYLVYPLPLKKKNDHQHIISCYMFNEKFIEKIMDED